MTDYANLMRFQKSQINGLTKHLAQFRFSSVRGERDALDAVIDRANEIGLETDYNNSHVSGEKFMFRKPRQITPEQTAFGKKWLREYFYKKDGTPRGGKRTEYVDDSVLKAADKVTRFEFVGVLAETNGYWSAFVSVLPIYRAYVGARAAFDYAPVYWGQPVLMRIEQ